jgi:hypothetical protein
MEICQPIKGLKGKKKKKKEVLKSPSNYTYNSFLFTISLPITVASYMFRRCMGHLEVGTELKKAYSSCVFVKVVHAWYKICSYNSIYM